MLGSSAGRYALAAIAVVAIVIEISGPARCQGEAFEAFSRTLRAPLRQQRPGRVLLVVQADDQGTTSDSAPDELNALRRQIGELCRDLSIDVSEPPRTDDLPATKLGTAQSPAQWRSLMEADKADAVLSVTWKENSTGLAVRVSLLNERRVFWSSRARLRRRKTANDQDDTGSGTSSRGLAGTLGSGRASFPGPGLPQTSAGWPSAAWDPLGTTPANGGYPAQGAGSSGAGGAPPSNDGSAGSSADFNARILEFARSNLGQQVGGGNCFELPAEALAAAGAKPGGDGNDFGQEVPLSELRPGDILQFWSARLVSPTAVWQLGEPGHNAIVGEVRGLTVSVYHQNIGGVKRVRQDVLDLGSLVSGEIIGYRAEAP